MATTQKLRSKLMGKLTELFQLDQPDLDFGFYRIMQAKSQQITSFIDKDLLQIIKDVFGQVDENRKTELQANIQKEIEAAKEYGVADPDNSPKVLAAKAKYDALKESATAEADVYDHLYRFFERYYDEGDFISRRYYARENAGKAAPFAIPYNGEEVKLHWANADQYYIKTAEYFTNFTFDLAKAKEVLDNQKSAAPLELPNNLKVHFRIVEASEGEHGNVKAAEDKKRFFVLHEETPIEFNEANELVINFEYKALPGGKNDVDSETEKALKAKFGKSLNKGDMPNLAIAEKVIADIAALENAKDYLDALSLLAPTDKITNRPLLAKYINQYTARNTCDYFIHKDLAGFLKRELDFYIKNEVMHLDDIENADAPAVENYLAKLKVIRKIATKLIDFLAQLENFQKKLWLKKKFVTETNYCITLDRISVGLYEEIATNDSQREEWVKLFAIDEIKGDAGVLPGMGSPAYSVPLTADFLKANDKLVLDTAFFGSDFKEKLISSIEDFDEQCDGLLVSSENAQAIRLLSERYRESIDALITDPPYNTGDDGFHYKDNYSHSSWATMINERLESIKPFFKSTAWLSFNINDIEFSNLSSILSQHQIAPVSTIAVKMSHMSGMKMSHADRKPPKIKEYITLSNLSDKARINPVFERCDWFEAFDRYDSFLYRNHSDNPEDWTRSSLRQAAIGEGVDVNNKDAFNKFCINNAEKIYQRAKNDSLYDLPRDGKFRTVVTATGMNKIALDGKEVLFASNYLKEVDGEKVPAKIKGDIWDDIGINNSHNEGGVSFDNGKKPVKLFERLVHMLTPDNATIIDIFAGSGTIAHAILNLNRPENKRKFVLIEMGEYFNSVLKKRIVNTSYSSDWQAGKPIKSGKSSSILIKYIRLESYEDTLNNLVFDDNLVRNKVIESNPSLKEDYMLRYLLDVETRGSQSLLNIDAFADPTSYSLVVKKPGSDEQVQQNIDLIETFNYLLGLRLEHMDAPQTFTASFTRKPDPELPEDLHTKLVVDGKVQLAADGKWWFRKLEGWVPADPMNPNNGQKEKVLIVWRKLTGNLEEDNLMLDEWFKKYHISSRESAKFDVIYVNGSNNLPNLKKDEERWKVRLIEESFHKLMWAVEGEA
ncbi:hypothetical protein AB5B87_000378 [Providencia rettgeri]|uniref:DNA methyltransferase n=1 Tax=Providencia rettgeri TaxID=587 RepID=UPI002895397D|nr:hypothetical protein [Providencia rettgeri]ELM3937009.1 hypothetical protein [Providencia rettgeri]EMA4644291.1 hypothetical protein [Providencia rettgeri]WRR96843.1 DNA methyltransferase [Providencia rettgeri]